jgi:hypothetical protein
VVTRAVETRRRNRERVTGGWALGVSDTIALEQSIDPPGD